MAINYPTYAVPRGYDKPDILGQFAKGLSFGQGIKNENDAKDALSAYVDTLYPNGAPPQDGQSLAALDPGSQLVNGEHAAAAGAVDPRLAALFGSNVNSSGNAATAATDPSLAPILAAYAAKTAQNESGGSNTAKNPNSSALGKYQFLTSTWDGLMQAHPELGLTADGRTDPAQQDRAMMAFTTDNARQLKSAGLPINPGTLYAAHFLGAGGATNVLGLADNTPMVSAVSPEVIQANPMLANMSVGDFKAWTAQHAATPQGGYQPPMAQQSPDASGGAQPAAAAPQFGQQPALPPREVLLSLVRNPATRDMGIALMRARTDPTVAATLASTLADTNLKNAEASAWGSGLKTGGYMPGPNGTIMAVPGGQADPNNPMNYNKVNPFGQTVAPDGTGGAATADSVPVQLGPDGRADPQQQAAYISTLPPALQPLVSGVISYTLDPNKVVSLKGNARTQLIAAAKAADPSFDMAAYPARAAMVKSLASGPMQQTLSSVNTTIQHLGELDGQVSGLNNGPFTPWNGLAQSISANTGHAEPVVFAQTAQAAANEMAKFFKGAGVTDVQGIKEWQDTISAANSPEQLHAAIKNAVGSLLQAKLNTLQEQYKATMGGGTLPGFLSSQSVATLTKLGIDPASLDPAVGAGQNPPAAPDNSAPITAINPQTGQRLQLTNGQWVPIQ